MKAKTKVPEVKPPVVIPDPRSFFQIQRGPSMPKISNRSFTGFRRGSR